LGYFGAWSKETRTFVVPWLRIIWGRN
jgi:hypothetical protein